MKKMGGFRISHELLKQVLGINPETWITGITYEPLADCWTVYVRGGESASFVGHTYSLMNTAEGSSLCIDCPPNDAA